jgi:hypothetical protein
MTESREALISEVVVRCSSLSLALRCAGSVRAEGLRVAERHPSAAVGTVAHAVLRDFVRDGKVEWDDLLTMAAVYGVTDTDEVAMLVRLGVDMWWSIAPSFADGVPQVEVPVLRRWPDLALTLTGTADVVVRRGRTASVLDWKTGRRDRSYRDQVYGYAACLMGDDDIETVTAQILWVRDREIETYTVTRAAVSEWIDRVSRDVGRWDGTYYPGEHCRHCARYTDCPAARALARHAVESIAGVEESVNLDALPAQRVVELYEQARHVASLAERVTEAVRARAIQDGSITGDEVTLSIREERVRELDPLKAFPVLTRRLGDEQMAECVRVSISAAESLVAKAAGKGNGASAVRALRQELENAGAVKATERRVLTTRRNSNEH